MTNPHPANLPDELIARLSTAIPGTHRSKENDLAPIEMILDLEGYDTSDPAWVKAVRKRAAKVIHAERASFGALSALINMRCAIRNEDIGAAIGLPKSTVQAIGAGKVPERLTEDQRARFHILLDWLHDQLDEVRVAIGA